MGIQSALEAPSHPMSTRSSFRLYFMGEFPDVVNRQRVIFESVLFLSKTDSVGFFVQIESHQSLKAVISISKKHKTPKSTSIKSNGRFPETFFNSPALKVSGTTRLAPLQSGSTVEGETNTARNSDDVATDKSRRWRGGESAHGGLRESRRRRRRRQGIID